MTFDEKLALALRDTAEERSKQMSAVTIKHRFSLSYRLWKHKALRDLRKSRYDSRWTLHKARRIVITALAVAIVLFATTACAVVGLTFGRFSFDDKREYSELYIANLSSDKTRIEEYYGLPEVDGWKMDYFGELTQSVLITYKRVEDIVSFKQSVIDGNMGHVNTENAVVEPMSVYEENDGFFIALNGGKYFVLYWIYDGYLFSILGNLNKDELLDLAYSTKIVEF